MPSHNSNKTTIAITSFNFIMTIISTLATRLVKTEALQVASYIPYWLVKVNLRISIAIGCC